MTYESKGWVDYYRCNCLFWSGTAAAGFVKPYTLAVHQCEVAWCMYNNISCRFPEAG